MFQGNHESTRDGWKDVGCQPHCCTTFHFMGCVRTLPSFIFFCIHKRHFFLDVSGESDHGLVCVPCQKKLIGHAPRHKSMQSVPLIERHLRQLQWMGFLCLARKVCFGLMVSSGHFWVCLLWVHPPRVPGPLPPPRWPTASRCPATAPSAWPMDRDPQGLLTSQ